MIANFDIRQHVEFNAKGRAVCPACALSKGTNHKKLNLSVMANGAYKCFVGCTPEEIREALGERTDRQVPNALAPQKTPAATPNVTVSPQKVKEASEVLLSSDGPAKQWLCDRGITPEMISRYSLGIVRSRVGNKMLPAISIPIPNQDATQYYQKKRLAPWLPVNEQPQGYQPWSQKGIPAQVYLTWAPAEAQSTYLCEGEWDAIVLGWAMRQAEAPIAVASFTCGAGTVPPAEQLDILPGTVYVFYDRNDKPDKQGKLPGEEGAKKVCLALGDRGKLALVPMPTGCEVKGWDVTDALKAGYTLKDFHQAAAAAISPKQSKQDNPIWQRLQWNDDLLDTAPDYTDWLVPDLLTDNELFLLASGPRMGKSLLAMTLTHAVATGGEFLGRPVTQGPVLYVCCEDSPSKVKEREIAQGWARGLPVVWLKKFKLSEVDHLREVIAEVEPRLIVLDTLSRIKDSNISESSAEMSQLLDPLQDLAQEMRTCVLLVHHTGKVSVENVDKIDIFDTVRGSSAIRAVCRGSLIIAASDRNYRLLVENGWGKHDLKILLDAHTLRWKLLGTWAKTVNGDQQDQVIAYLKTVESASIEQIHQALGIQKKVLYVVLDRLRMAEAADQRVVKEGKRRAYTYRLVHQGAIQQLNTLLNSATPYTDGDVGTIFNKNTFFPRNGSIIDRDVPVDVTISDRSSENAPFVELPKNRIDRASKAHADDVSNSADRSNAEKGGTLPVEYAPKGGRKVDREGVTPIQQLFNKGIGKTGSKPDSAGNPAYSTAIQQDAPIDPAQSPIDPPPFPIDPTPVTDVNKEKFLYKGKNLFMTRLCKGKHLEILATNGDYATVNHPDWLVTQTIPVAELKPVK